MGAAAVMYKGGRETETRRFRLGTLKKHEVYDSEGTGMVLTITTIGNCEEVEGETSIYTDSEAAIRAILLRTPTLSHNIWDAFHAEYRQAKKKHPNMQLTIRWIPAHINVEGNERAEREPHSERRGELITLLRIGASSCQ